MHAAIAKDLELLPIQLGANASSAAGSPELRGPGNGQPSFAVSLDRAQAGGTDGPTASDPQDTPRASLGKQPTWTNEARWDQMETPPPSGRPRRRDEAAQEPAEEADVDGSPAPTVALADPAVLAAPAQPPAAGGKPEAAPREAGEARPAAGDPVFAVSVPAGDVAEAGAPAPPARLATSLPQPTMVQTGAEPSRADAADDKALTMARAQLTIPPRLQSTAGRAETSGGPMMRLGVGAEIAEGATIARVEAQAPQAPDALDSAPQVQAAPSPTTARLSAATRAYDASSAPADPVLVPAPMPSSPAVAAAAEPGVEQVAEPAVDAEAPATPRRPSAQPAGAAIGLGREQTSAPAARVPEVPEQTVVPVAPQATESARVEAQTIPVAPERLPDSQPDLSAAPTAPIAARAAAPTVEPAPAAVPPTVDDTVQGADLPDTSATAPAPTRPEPAPMPTAQSLADTDQTAVDMTRPESASTVRQTAAAAYVPAQPAPAATARLAFAQGAEAQTPGATAPETEPRQASTPVPETAAESMDGAARAQAGPQPLASSPTVETPVTDATEAGFRVETQPSSPRSTQPAQTQGAAPSWEAAEPASPVAQSDSPERAEAAPAPRSGETARPVAGGVAGRAPVQAEPSAQVQRPASPDAAVSAQEARRTSTPVLPTAPQAPAAAQVTGTVGVPEGAAPAAEAPAPTTPGDGASGAANAGTRAPAPDAGPARFPVPAAPAYAPTVAPVTDPDAAVAVVDGNRQQASAATVRPAGRLRPPAAQSSSSASITATAGSGTTAVSGTTSATRPPTTTGAPVPRPQAGAHVAPAPATAIAQPATSAATAPSQRESAAPPAAAEASRSAAPQVTAQVAGELARPAAPASPSGRSPRGADAQVTMGKAPSTAETVAATDATRPMGPVQEPGVAPATQPGQGGAPSIQGPAAGARQARRQAVQAARTVSASAYAGATAAAAQGTRTSRRAQTAVFGAADTAVPSGPDAPSALAASQLASGTSLAGISQVDDLRSVERARHVVSQIAQIEDATPGSLRIDLDWEDVGVRHLAVSLQDGRASLQFYCTSTNSASHLRALETPIREALEANGLQLGEFGATYDGRQRQAPEWGQQDRSVTQAVPTTPAAPRRASSTPTRSATAPRPTDGRLDVLV